MLWVSLMIAIFMAGQTVLSTSIQATVSFPLEIWLAASKIAGLLNDYIPDGKEKLYQLMNE